MWKVKVKRLSCVALDVADGSFYGFQTAALAILRNTLIINGL